MMAGPGDTNDHGQGTPGNAGSMDIGAHRAGYEAFMAYSKWGTLIAAIVAFVAVVIIAA